jgi:hypothetical protein
MASYLLGGNPRSDALICQRFFILPTKLVKVSIYQGNSLINRPSQDHLSKVNRFLASSFSATFDALFFESVFMIIIGPTYDRGTMQRFTTMRASASIPFMEIVSYNSAALT